MYKKISCNGQNHLKFFSTAGRAKENQLVTPKWYLPHGNDRTTTLQVPVLKRD